VDALSDLLRLVRLSGGMFLDAQFTAPWCISAHVAPEDCRLMLAEPLGVVAYHYVVEGRMLLSMPGQEDLQLVAGSLVLLPRNDRHVLASEPGLTPVSGDELVLADLGSGLARISHGGGGAGCRIVCGFVGTEAERHPLLEALPARLVLDLNGRAGSDWIASSFRYAAADLAAIRVGAAIALAKLSELLFVEAVRHHVESLGPGEGGWLAGLRDPAVGRALALLHSQVGHPWTTESLAREVFLSRSAFAERFVALMGVPPMTYLTRWRLQVAAQKLRESHRPVAQVALDVGYDSQGAFARAFRREFARSPLEWRRHGGEAPPD